MVRALWPGLDGPGRAPRLHPGTIRRTSTVDGFRPDGPRGDVILTGRARDLRRLNDRDEVTDLAYLRARVAWLEGQKILELRTRPRIQGTESLVGAGARIGFRDAFARTFPDRWGDGTVLTLLFDELPMTTSLSRHAHIQNGTISLTPADEDPAAIAGRTPLHMSGRPICAAWVPGGAYETVAATGKPPLLTEGLPARPLLDPEDARAWHWIPRMPRMGFRRHRLIDVKQPGGPEDSVVAESTLRDSYVNEQDEELVIHEYQLNLLIDPTSNTIIEASATPRSLPGPDCAAAATSASRLVGLHVQELREKVRHEFKGLGTCTHLNDQMRAVGDVHRLITQLQF